jgi:3-(3-hydroxy-phenyl)propionate hydroxylase
MAHHPETRPRPSLYFPYRVHPAWTPGAAAARSAAAVAIVGAGPVGLTTALGLATLGVRSVVLAAEQQVCEGSRAIVFTRRSLEILQQVGVSERVLARGLPWRCGNSFYRDQRVFRLEAPHDADERFHPMTNLQQQVLEDILLEAAVATGLVEVRWGNRVTGVQQVDRDVARLAVDTPGGPYALDADWVVAADGARSVLRQSLGLRLEGDAYEGRFVIADIRIDLPLPTERLAFFDPAWNPGNTVLMHREPEGMWRIDYQLPPGESPEHALAPERLRARIDAHLASIGQGHLPWELDWSSVYSARTMTLPAYVHGRVLFAGDAAHLLPIFGVRGANTGFQDAQNLAWKLACVVRGLAPAGLLDSYSGERVTAAREIIAESARSTRFMTPPSSGFRLLRDAVLSLSLRHEFVRPLFHWRTSRAHQHVGSVLNTPDDDDARFTAGPGHGANAPNAALGDSGFLLDVLGLHFSLLWFGDTPAIPEALGRAARALRDHDVPARVIAVSIGAGRVDGADVTAPDPDGHVARRYGAAPGATYLLRPDQHVCARWIDMPDTARILTAVDTALARKPRVHP